VRALEVVKRVGITYRMLDYWARTDLIRPSISEARGSGTQRRYSETDVLVVLAIKRLLDAGISLQTIRRALPVLRDGLEGGQRWLVLVDGRPAVCGGDELLDLVASGRITVVLDLSERSEPSPLAG
jgi:DNA-binding transcriptional MerR regulator